MACIGANTGSTASTGSLPELDGQHVLVNPFAGVVDRFVQGVVTTEAEFFEDGQPVALIRTPEGLKEIASPCRIMLLRMLVAVGDEVGVGEPVAAVWATGASADVIDSGGGAG